MDGLPRFDGPVLISDMWIFGPTANARTQCQHLNAKSNAQ